MAAVVPAWFVVASIILKGAGVPGVTLAGFGLKRQVGFAGRFDGQTKETFSPLDPKPPVGTTSALKVAVPPALTEISDVWPPASCTWKSSPIPERVALVEAPPGSVMVNLAVRDPVFCGVNETLIAQAELWARVVVHDFPSTVKSPGFAPTTSTARPVMATPGELLLRVNCCVGAVPPTG